MVGRLGSEARFGSQNKQVVSEDTRGGKNIQRECVNEQSSKGTTELWGHQRREKREEWSGRSKKNQKEECESRDRSSLAEDNNQYKVLQKCPVRF